MKPIPLSERRPTDKDCDKKGFCWYWSPIANKIQLESWVGCWNYMNEHRPYLWMTRYTHWLPYDAFPLPEVNND